MTDYVGSNSYLIKFNPNATGAQKRFNSVYQIPGNKPALIIFGGALTTTDNKAFGYIEHIANAIPNTKDIDIYSAVYQFESLDPMLVKAHTFRRAGRKLKLDDNISIAQRKEQQLKQINNVEPVPGYIEDLFDSIIAPRIVTNNPQATNKNMRGLVIYSHCHGAIVVNRLAEMTEVALKDAGMTPDMIAQSMSGIIVIQHNPTAPLENARFTTLNFMSGTDDTLNYYDDFSKTVLQKADLAPAFLGKDYANVFIAGKLNATNGSEHGFSIGFDSAQDKLTPDGRVIFDAQKNALRNAIEYAKTGAPLPAVEQIANGGDVNISQMRDLGRQIYKAR